MDTKICKSCNIEKNLLDFHKSKNSFDGHRPICKECRKQESKNRYSNNTEYFEKYRKENREKILEKLCEWRKKNPEYRKKYYSENREKELNYYLENLDKIREYQRNYNKKKYEKNLLYSLKSKLNGRLHKLLKKNDFEKKYRLCEILGCDLKKLKLHLENKFTEGMSWELMGKKIHIDHIIPCSSAKNEKELIELFHYQNLQPLWATENIKKSNKIINGTEKLIDSCHSKN